MKELVLYIVKQLANEPAKASVTESEQDGVTLVNLSVAEEDKGKISFSANTPDAPWLRGAQDRLSVFLQLGSLLAGAPASYPVGSSVSLYTAGPREADTWTFTVESEETLQLPAGEAATLKLTRKPQRDYDQTVEIWFAPSMSYLPVRSRITQQNGDFVDQQLRVVEKP